VKISSSLIISTSESDSIGFSDAVSSLTAIVFIFRFRSEKEEIQYRYNNDYDDNGCQSASG
jgi:hypothetical protein